MHGALAALALGLGLAAMAAGAHAADAATDAMQAAYAPYRQALFATNTGKAEASAKTLGASRAQWDKVVQQFGATPPAPYDRDPAFSQTLEQVNAVYAKAGEQVQAGELSEAHETLEQVRHLLADLRQRNGVVVYSDAMNAYHAAMEQVLGQGRQLLEEPKGELRLMAQLGVLQHLAQALQSQAPAAWRDDAEFNAARTAVTQSVARLHDALLAGDKAAVQQALQGLKKPYAMLFVRWG
jgi:hypothetical protein